MACLSSFSVTLAEVLSHITHSFVLSIGAHHGVSRRNVFNERAHVEVKFQQIESLAHVNRRHVGANVNIPTCHGLSCKDLF